MNKVKVQFENSPEQAELIKLMGSQSPTQSKEALAAFVTLVGPILNQVLLQANTTDGFFRTLTFRDGENPFLALEPYADTQDSQFAVWSAGMPGGLPTNLIYRPTDVVPFLMRRLDSAVSYYKNRLGDGGGINYVAAGLQRMAQEIMLLDQNDAWLTMLSAIGGTNTGNLVTSVDGIHFTLSDWNKALTKFRRLNKSWVGGTPVGASVRPTDVYLSPGIMETIRSFAFQPVNTLAPNNIAAGATTGAVSLPDADRQALFSGGGASSFFGVVLHELLELEGSYNTILQNAIASPNSISSVNIVDGSGSKNLSSAGITNTIVFVDRTRDFAFKAVRVGGQDNSQTFNLIEDDQFNVRSGKVGMFGYMESGRIITDLRGVLAMILSTSAS